MARRDAQRSVRESDTESSPDGRLRKAGPLPRGVVRLRFVDERSGAPLSSVEVRGESGDRLRVHTLDGEGEIALTPGTWTLCARVAPLAAHTFEPFSLADGQVRDLGTTRLQPG